MSQAAVSSPAERVTLPAAVLQCVLLVLLLVGDYQMWLDYDTPSGVFDFNCQYKDGGIEKPFCKVKGNHLALMNECDKWAECGAITINMESNGQDGWLKRAIRTNVGASNTFRRGWLYLLKTK